MKFTTKNTLLRILKNPQILFLGFVILVSCSKDDDLNTSEPGNPVSSQVLPDWDFEATYPMNAVIREDFTTLNKWQVDTSKVLSGYPAQTKLPENKTPLELKHGTLTLRSWVSLTYDDTTYQYQVWLQNASLYREFGNTLLSDQYRIDMEFDFCVPYYHYRSSNTPHGSVISGGTSFTIVVNNLKVLINGGTDNVGSGPGTPSFHNLEFGKEKVSIIIDTSNSSNGFLYRYNHDGLSAFNIEVEPYISAVNYIEIVNTPFSSGGAGSTPEVSPCTMTIRNLSFGSVNK